MYQVDVYLRVRRAVMVEGMSIRETARTFGLHRDTVHKMLAYSVPPGYRRQSPPRRPGSGAQARAMTKARSKAWWATRGAISWCPSRPSRALRRSMPTWSGAAWNERMPSSGATEVFGSERLTGALLDRLTHHVHILKMNGESYRLKRSRENAVSQAPDDPDEE